MGGHRGEGMKGRIEQAAGDITNDKASSAKAR